MTFDVRQFGAAADGVTLDTAAFQSAADACRELGGGTILVSAGTYLCASVRLYSNTTLRLEQGARVLLCPDEAQYGLLRGKYDEPFTREAAALLNRPAGDGMNFMQEMFLAALRSNTDTMFFAKDAENIVLEGEGVLDGQYPCFFNMEPGGEEGVYAAIFSDQAPRWLRRLDEGCLRPKCFRPHLVVMDSCRNVTIRGLRLQDGPFFNIRIVDSELVRLESLDIETNIRCQNTDGINLAGCRMCFIRDCRIVTGDDCIALSTGEMRGLKHNCENIVVSNCIGRTYCNFFRIFIGIDADVCYAEGIGTERALEISRNQVVRNINISNCILEQGGCVANIVAVLGGVENVQLNNIRSYHKGKDAALFIAIQKEGWIRNITVDGLEATAKGAVTVLGTDRESIQHVLLRNCRFRIEPKSKLFGNGIPDPLIQYWVSDLAPYNIYLRHVKDVRLLDCELIWGETDLEDMMEIADAAKRPPEYNAIWREDMNPCPNIPCVDAWDVEGLRIREFVGEGLNGAEAIRLHDVLDSRITQC